MIFASSPEAIVSLPLRSISHLGLANYQSILWMTVRCGLSCFFEQARQGHKILPLLNATLDKRNRSKWHDRLTVDSFSSRNSSSHRNGEIRARYSSRKYKGQSQRRIASILAIGATGWFINCLLMAFLDRLHAAYKRKLVSAWLKTTMQR
ncbi:hypothetical protein GGR57DRAFT_438932 [Xylariaceae sp. FL1272]|nr:hypothetical protein GGR57DRAFT_438932 [Xylariaceae sp. FL1272]